MSTHVDTHTPAHVNTCQHTHMSTLAALAPLPLKLDKNARQTVVAGEPDENHLLRRMHEKEAEQMSSTAKNGGKEKKNPKTPAAKNGGKEKIICSQKRRQKKNGKRPCEAPGFLALLCPT